MSDNKIVEASYGRARPADPERKPMTVPKIRGRKGGDPLVMITAYDATFARMLDEAGADMLWWATRWAWWSRGKTPRCR